MYDARMDDSSGWSTRGEPNTPLGGELYAEDGNSKLSEQVHFKHIAP